MNQQKTGEFLKHLRKNKGLTQEQLPLLNFLSVVDCHFDHLIHSFHN